jgi:phosphonate transport system substrate-binding protein
MALRFKSILCAAAIALLAFSGGCRAAADRPFIDLEKTEPASETSAGSSQNGDNAKLLRIAVSPTLSQNDTIGAFREIAQFLGKKLDRQAVLLEKKSYSEINALLANGGADLAFLANGAYNAYAQVDEIEPLVMQVRFGVPYYYSYIIVPKDSPAAKLQDLRGKTFAFTDPLSFSGYLVPVYMLKQIGENPENLFSNYLFTYGHEKALQAVANQVVDGAAIGSHVYCESLEKGNGLAEKVKIIAVSEKSGTGPVVVRKSLGAEAIQVLREAFLHMHEEADLEEAMATVLVDYYIEPDETLYELPRKIIGELSDP